MRSDLMSGTTRLMFTRSSILMKRRGHCSAASGLHAPAYLTRGGSEHQGLQPGQVDDHSSAAAKSLASRCALMRLGSFYGCNAHDSAVWKYPSYSRHPRLAILYICVQVLEDIETDWRDRDGCWRPRTARTEHCRDLAARRDLENRTAAGCCDEDRAVLSDGEATQVRFASRLCAGDSCALRYGDALRERGDQASFIDPSHRLVFCVVERTVGA